MTTLEENVNEEPLIVVDDDSVIVVDAESAVPVERRRYERLTVYLKVRWEGVLGCHEGTLSDISVGGCFILTDCQATLRELIRVEIQIHTGEWVKVWGEVTNHFPGIGFGVKYTEFEEEEQGQYILTLEQTKSITSSVEALRGFSRSVSEPREDAPAAMLVGREEYRTRLMLVLPQVNKTLLGLPDCQKKTALRLSMQAYADVYRVWGAMSEAAAGDRRNLLEAFKCLKEKYSAPGEVIEALSRGDVAAVLGFIQQKARVCLTLVS